MEQKQKAAQILYADAWVVVCVKPVGVESEREMPALLAGQLGGQAAGYWPVHRLDRAVAGVMVYARSTKAAAALSAQIQAHSFGKEYLAVAGGWPQPPRGEMADLLYHDKTRRKAYPAKSLRRGVKEARLQYAVLERVLLQGEPAALTWVKLETGRFHQIRAQFAARGLPLLGDGKYGSRTKGCPVALFCANLRFCHPQRGEAVTFTAAPPAEFPWNSFDLNGLRLQHQAILSGEREAGGPAQPEPKEPPKR